MRVTSCSQHQADCSNEVSDKTTPVDSLYTKKTLTNLHPNIMVQRSPSHFQTGTFYWSHVRGPSKYAEANNSTKSSVSLMKQSPLWVDSTCVTPDGILHNISSWTKTIPSLMDQMDQSGGVKIISTSESPNLPISTNHSRIRLIEARFLECRGTTSAFKSSVSPLEISADTSSNDGTCLSVQRSALKHCKEAAADDRTTNGECHSCFRRRTSQTGSCMISNYKALVRCRFADLSDRGLWAHLPRLNILFKTRTSSVSDTSGMGFDASYRDVRTLCLH